MILYSSTVKKQSTIKVARNYKKSGSIKFFIVFYVLLGLIIILGIFYGVVTNKVATIGYNIKSTEKKIDTIKNNNDSLKIKISELKSVKLLENKVNEIGMVKPSEIDYLNIGKEVALKR